MSDLIEAHHEAEGRLYRLRLLRDTGSPDFRPEDEDAALDEMEALWYRMTEEERRLLEVQCEARSLPGFVSVARCTLPAVDVTEEEHARRGLRILQPVG